MASTTPARKPRQSRAARAAQLSAVKPQAEGAKPEAKAAPEPEPKLTAKLDLGARKVEYWFPAIVMADGTRIACPHSRYGHESEKAAQRCGRALAAQHGVKL